MCFLIPGPEDRSKIIQNFEQTRFVSKANNTLNELYFKRDPFPVTQNGKMGFINKNGKIIIQAKFAHAEPFKNELALVRVNKKWGFVNKSGKIIVQPQYENISDFSEGLALVKVDEKWGFIDSVGNIIIDPQFDDAWPFSEGFALVKDGDKWGYIDKHGKIIIPPRFDGSYSSEGKNYLDLHKDALNIAQSLNHRKEEGNCLYNIGLYYWKLDNYSKALNYFEDALMIFFCQIVTVNIC